MVFAKQLLSTSLLLSSSLWDFAQALDNELPNKFVNLRFNKKYGDHYDTASTDSRKPKLELVKRDGSDYEEVELTNQQSFYSVEVDVGTPSQRVTVLLDTGSSDFWVMGSDNPYCSDDTSTTGIDCSEFGTFDSSSSSTFHNNGTAFNIHYGDGSFALGTWGTDTVSIDDITLDALSLAVANSSNSSMGVIGLGLAGLETTYSSSHAVKSGQTYQYANFPLALKNAGIVAANAYSLYLNDPEETTGNILFGAVDHSLYSGQLYTIPLVNIYSGSGFKNAVEFDVTLNGIGIVDSSGSATTVSTTPIIALLDSGTTLTYFPTQYVSLLAAQLGAQYSSSNGYYTISCDAMQDTTTKLVFDFGGFHINATLADFVVQSGTSTCFLSIIPQNSSSAILGDTFLNNAYVVYDLDNLEISMAQAKWDQSSDEDIEVISSSVPSAVKAPGYSNTWSTTMSITSGGNIFTVNADASATVSNSGSSASASSSSASSGSNSRTTSTLSTSSRKSTQTSTRTSSGTSSRRSSTSTSTSSSNNKEENGSTTVMVPSISFFVLAFLSIFVAF
ncbi:hypothetical protein NCAS_0C03300 [Naumovozyma castellii]|uniref:Peptidase A1 domain-containing protein n=1 Tax=Naumovozyma castellii TaxID=27288 RepID=G0VCV9_NAUCA|nr:hypothetical protein NCAS_0C03300 [Naumovozyma castellii CBS 4309]CCC69320.1 hypothetical protein NCAS_0C03300 [Naumovozyma castellii CBS 4309]